MDPLMSYALQELNEKRYAKKHIDPMLREWFMGNEAIQKAIAHGQELLNTYMTTTYSYASKNERIAGLVGINTYNLVVDVFVGIAYITKPQLFTGVSAQLAGRLGWDDKPAAITTMAEILAVLCETNAYDIVKESKFASLTVESLFVLPDNIQTLVENCEYLPPMIHEPRELKNNMSGAYLTINESLILGKGNHHDGDICLDVLNLVNKTKLSLNTEFLSAVEEDPSEVTVDSLMEKAAKKGKYTNKTEALVRLKAFQENWGSFKKQSYEFYHLMESQGNEFNLTFKNDKRGRMYAQGYHISTQGTSFKKAMIDFANKEIVEIPEGFF